MATAPSLKALAESKADGIQKATTFKVDPHAVHEEPGFNLRIEGPELDAYVDQIEAAMRAGAYVPAIDLAVIDGRMILRDGHCRTKAARRIEGYLLEARQIRGNECDAVFHMLGSDQRKSFSPVEVARGYMRLVNMGQDVAAIAARLGLHRSTVENALALADAPLAVQGMVAAGEVSATTAVKTVRKHGTQATEKLAEAVKTAKAAGKAKATPKHVEPKPRGQTLPPPDAFRAFVERVAAMSTVARPSREETDKLIADARALLAQ